MAPDAKNTAYGNVTLNNTPGPRSLPRRRVTLSFPSVCHKYELHCHFQRQRIYE